jgi:AraC family transcriptional regulator, transcriptional activator of pobA
LSSPRAIFAGSPPRLTRSRVTYEAYAVSRTSTRPQVDSAVPVYQYPTELDTPPVSVVRGGRDHLAEHGRHIHNFPALWYGQGLVYVVAAGEVIDPAQVSRREGGIRVFFDPAALGGDGRSPWPAWRAHPLLFPFLHEQSGRLLRLEVPAARRLLWDAAIGSIESELAARQEGYREGGLAHLTLLLIDLARLAADVVGDLRRSGEPLLAEVFAVIAGATPSHCRCATWRASSAGRPEI